MIESYRKPSKSKVDVRKTIIKISHDDLGLAHYEKSKVNAIVLGFSVSTKETKE